MTNEVNEDFREYTFPEAAFSVRKIKAIFDQRIIGQEETKRRLAAAIVSHYLALQYNGTCQKEPGYVKQPSGAILLYGPTGCGKTEFFRALHDALDLPVYIADASSLTKAGYKGSNIEDCVNDYLSLYGKDAWKGIFVFDEVDKLMDSEVGGESGYPGGTGVMDELLRLLEGKLYKWPESVKNPPSTYFDTADLLFVFAGSFARLTRKKAEAYIPERKVVGF